MAQLFATPGAIVSLEDLPPAVVHFLKRPHATVLYRDLLHVTLRPDRNQRIAEGIASDLGKLVGEENPNPSNLYLSFVMAVEQVHSFNRACDDFYS
ncbi:hypothetical protein JCM11641_008230 [Rhodosporidiobolus odoratus]